MTMEMYWACYTAWLNFWFDPETWEAFYNA